MGTEARVQACGTASTLSEEEVATHGMVHAAEAATEATASGPAFVASAATAEKELREKLLTQARL